MDDAQEVTETLHNHEPPTIDSGDQMPGESTLWGDRFGHQQRSDEPRKERWLFALAQLLLGKRASV